MKKKIILVIALFILTGCTNINNLSIDDCLSYIATSSNQVNTYRTGYSYYLPKGVSVSDSTLYNEVLEDSRYKYYLYVDVVSYYEKIEKEYITNSTSMYSSKINYDDKYGYVEVNLLENDKYLVEIMYNYAKIEVIVDSSSINIAMVTSINILKSIVYNDSIIANLLGDDILNFNEEEINIFNTQGSSDNYLTIDDSSDTTESTIPDPDLVK